MDALNGLINRPALTIQKTDGKINTEHQTEEIEVQLKDHEMNLDKSPRQVELTTQYPEVNIDLTQSQIERGNHTSDSLRQESAQKGKQTAQEYTARKARQGFELARIEEEGNPLITQAVEEAIREVEVTIDSVPKTPPQIEIMPGEINMDLTPEEVQVNLTERLRSLYFDYYRLNTYLSTRPQLDVLVT